MPLRPLPFIVDARQHPFRGPLRWDGCGGLACPCGDLQGLQFNCPYAELARIAEVLHQYPHHSQEMLKTCLIFF